MIPFNEHQSPTYRLHGKSLAIAKELHAHSKIANEEYRQIGLEVAHFADALMVKFDEKHDATFRDIFHRLGQELGITVDEMRKFNLDATYLEDHDIAFMKQGPIEDNVMIMDARPQAQIEAELEQDQDQQDLFKDWRSGDGLA